MKICCFLVSAHTHRKVKVESSFDSAQSIVWWWGYMAWRTKLTTEQLTGMSGWWWTGDVPG